MDYYFFFAILWKYIHKVCEQLVWHIPFPLGPGICLLWRRLLCFLCGYKVFTACPACLGSAVVSMPAPSVTSWLTVVDCIGSGNSEDFKSPSSTKVKSSEVELHFTSVGASLSLCDASSVKISSCVPDFWISFISAARRDQGCWDSWEEDGGSACTDAPVEEAGNRGLMGGSSWRLTVSKCRIGGAALEFNLERRAEITVCNSPPSLCTEESSVWRWHAK